MWINKEPSRSWVSLPLQSLKRKNMNDIKPITAYKIIKGNSTEEIEEKMQEVIDNRYYQPLGGVSITYTEGGVVIYAQAVVALG